jgi:hypothetical protein
LKRIEGSVSVKEWPLSRDDRIPFRARKTADLTLSEGPGDPDRVERSRVNRIDR